ncbi:hypothetical protein BP6252_00345 [Coleophoma cylindrospora]|uniref:Uncharacterized protein n=1 Tax=Coleophoma cylindrospora TaxID=1849047 RepID=A0A3D8SPQ9_9HELO|nr:hypothetical protein BP6252_00345 [Coleophoma cylindrospora]
MRSDKKKSYAGISELQPPMRNSKLLTPTLIASAVTMLAMCSTIGILIAASIFSSSDPYARYIGVTQAFTSIAAAFSVFYILLHGAAAYRNHPIGPSRPPVNKVHALCFIFARLGLLAWVVAIIANAAVVSKPNICQGGGKLCRLQVIDLTISSFGFINSGIILAALESCQHPFQSPRLCSGVTCRVSAFGDDIVDGRPFSTTTIETIDEKSSELSAESKIIWQNNVKRKPVPSRSSTTTSIPGEYPEEASIDRPLTPVLLLPRTKSTRNSWGEEWKHLAQETQARPIPIALSKSLSLNSLPSSKASEPRPGRFDSCLSKRQGRSKTVTPSSSISNLSRRSPLATMRVAEFPEIAICPDVYVLPPKIPPPHEWSSSRTESLQQLLPVADLHAVQRTTSVMQRRPSAVVAPLMIRKVNRQNSLSRPPMGLVRRSTLDVKVPGAFPNYRLQPDEMKLDAHAKVVDAESVRTVDRNPSQRTVTAKRTAHVPSPQQYAPFRVDSRSRYRDTRPYWPGPQVVARHNTISGLAQHPLEPENKPGNVNADGPEARDLRRLTLGDIDVAMGKLW